MQIDAKAFALGNALRAYLAGRGAKKAEKYSYNGVVLPALPEWDKETYPYAAITSLGGSKQFVAFSADVHHGKNPFGDDTLVASSYQTWLYTPDSWNSPNYAMPDYVTIEIIFWADFDIYTSDGTLYLAASDPIPVYE